MSKLNFTQEEIQAIKAQLAKAGSDNLAVASVAQADFAKAVETPLRKVLLSGDIIKGIFTPEDFSTNPRVEYPLDLLTPGDERNFYAYVVPGHGRIPERRVESDYLMIPTYMIGNAIDCTLRYIKFANWPVVQRMIEVMEAGFVKKMNDDGWQTILAAATDRNILVNDPNAAGGQFTPRLITLLRTFMRRNGGGNSATNNRAALTDLYISPESLDDVRAWGLDLIPDAARNAIYTSPDDGTDMVRIFGVNLHSLDELGEGQEYQLYYTSTLAGSLAASDYEICVGLDQSRNDAFVMPWVDAPQVWEDNTLHRRGMFGMYGRAEMGFACLDSRRTILGSI